MVARRSRNSAAGTSLKLPENAPCTASDGITAIPCATPNVSSASRTGIVRAINV